VLRQPGVTCAIAGAKRPAQIREHLEAIALVERDDIWPEVDRIVASFHG